MDRETSRARDGDRMAGRSLDPAEVAKFSAIATEWWDQAGKFAPLHRLNPTRLAFIREQALMLVEGPSGGKKPLEGLRILDLGCGGGLVSVPLARLGADVTGVDASEETIQVATGHARALGLTIDYRVGEAETLVGEAYDLVLALEIIEHVADAPAFLQACAEIARPGGKLIVSTINRTQRARLFALIGAERFLKWVPEGTHEFDKLVTPDELQAGAPELHWEEPVGLSFDPLQREWKLSRDVSVNYFRAATKPPAM